MDKASLNNEVVSAYEISQNYHKEKSVRIDSKNKRIKCIDPDCKSPILRYCHGDKKGAYFAHLSNTECDYEQFDKNDDQILKQLRIRLYLHFSYMGYSVKTEYKLLDHHYSPLYCSKDGESFVIEMGTSKTTIGYVEKMVKEYSSKEIPVKWLVVGEETFFEREDELSFLKRYLLNESKNKDFILVHKDEIVQSRFDKQIKELGGSGIYRETAKIEDLQVVDGELCINGYNSRFREWEENEIKKNKLRKQERERIVQNSFWFSKASEIKKPITNNFEQTQKQRMVYTCSKCGKKAEEGEFFTTKKDQGICWECHYGKEKYEEIKRKREG